jgi:hypothetical protein
MQVLLINAARGRQLQWGRAKPVRTTRVVTRGALPAL